MHAICSVFAGLQVIDVFFRGQRRLSPVKGIGLPFMSVSMHDRSVVREKTVAIRVPTSIFGQEQRLKLGRESFVLVIILFVQVVGFLERASKLENRSCTVNGGYYVDDLLLLSLLRMLCPQAMRPQLENPGTVLWQSLSAYDFPRRIAPILQSCFSKSEATPEDDRLRFSRLLPSGLTDLLQAGRSNG